MILKTLCSSSFFKSVLAALAISCGEPAASEQAPEVIPEVQGPTEDTTDVTVADPTPTPPPVTKAPTEPPSGYIANEKLYLPVLEQELETHWPDIRPRAVFGALVYQETCPSLTSKICWSPHAELKTSREYGFGLGQLTVTAAFDNFKGAKDLHPSLKNWEWENRYHAEFQLRTMVLMNRFNYGKLTWAANDHERLAMTFAAYNGGLGGVLSDRTVCRAAGGCDGSKWFGHIEHHSKKAKVPASGYGQSFFQINRQYVKNVMIVRPPRYRYFFGELDDEL